jgi:hypothetical protein
MWIAPHVLLIPVAVVMFRKGLHKEYRVFFFYLLYEFVQFAVLFTMWCTEASHAMMMTIDLLGRSGSVALRFGMIMEMFESPVANNVPLQKTMARMFNAVTVLLVVLAALFVGSIYHNLPNYGLLRAYVPIEALNLAQCELLICVFLWHRFLGVRMLPCVLGMAFGIGLIVGFEPFMLAWVSGHNLISRDSLQMAGFHIAVVGWLFFVTVRQTIASNFNAAQLVQVRDWASGVGRITRL